MIEQALQPVHRTKFDSFSKSELVYLLQKTEDLLQKSEDSRQKTEDRLQKTEDLLQKSEEMNQKLKKKVASLSKENERLGKLVKSLSDFLLEKGFKNILLKHKLFGKSSEKEPSSSPPDQSKPPVRSKPRRSVKRVQLPSKKYPDAPIEEQDIKLDNPPSCPSCGKGMEDSGMTEDSERLTVIPKQFFITRQKRHKYICTHCCCIKTAPAPPRIKEKSTYSDDMMMDVSLSKYCDLIPIGRYSDMAKRDDLERIPPNSLIQLTHYVAVYVKGTYEKLKGELQSSQVLHADETSHKMLERHDDKSWYLWGFSNSKASYFEIHNTRSGDVPLRILRGSRCEYLVSDVFSGYNRAVREVNEDRGTQNLPLISNVYCNAHARRKFKESIIATNKEDEAQYFVDIYQKIYSLEGLARGRSQNLVLWFRELMKPLFVQMKAKAISLIEGYSSKSPIGQALGYFLNNYEGLTLFLTNSILPIDNNSQERQIRSPVVGRKTWYGTHSKKGAQTNAILFSLVESCKLNNVNPRKYLKDLVEDIHQGKETSTPYQYKKKLSENSSLKDDYG